LSIFTDGIIKGVVAAGVTMSRICLVVDEESDRFDVALRGSDAEGCSTIVVVGIDLPALDLQDRHIL
jgi:hypothetical protein